MNILWSIRNIAADVFTLCLWAAICFSPENPEVVEHSIYVCVCGFVLSIFVALQSISIIYRVARCLGMGWGKP
jgi:hypothetical protein